MSKKKLIAFILVAVLSVGFLVFKVVTDELTKINNNIIGLTQEEMQEDVRYLEEILMQSYPFLDELTSQGYDYHEVIEACKEDVKTIEDDTNFLRRIRAVSSELGKFGHLTVIDGHFYDLINRSLENGENSLTAKELERATIWYSERNKPESKLLYASLDRTPGKMRKDRGKYTEEKVEEVLAEQLEGNLTIESLNDHVDYVKIDSFLLDYYDTDKSKLANWYPTLVDKKAIIIDIRDNPGGADGYWEKLLVEPLIQEPLKHEKYYLLKEDDFTRTMVNRCFKNIKPIDALPILDQVEDRNLERFSQFLLDEQLYEPNLRSAFSGDIYLLVDETVYSASENFAMLCKNTGFATVVGSQTSGDGGIMDPIILALPNSGLLIRYSLFYGLNNDGTSNVLYGTTPDVVVNHEDNPIQVCLQLIND